MGKQISYYEFPNGHVVKDVESDGVYRFNPVSRAWERDDALTAEFAWDRPYGEPCSQLRQKVDVSCDLPPFPHASEFQPGSTVLIGAWPQRSPHDFSPIAWIVLETRGSIALCMSRDCLITSGYCDPRKVYGKPELLWWENSLAREICNHRFHDAAFSAEEKARLIPRKMTSVQLGSQCEDSVFLLSEQEAYRYLPSGAHRQAQPTPLVRSEGAFMGWTEETRACTSWWLLPEENAYGMQDGSIYPKAILPTGDSQFHGRNAYHTDFTLRPCIQIQFGND